jgi:hypothetical protein
VSLNQMNDGPAARRDGREAEINRADPAPQPSEPVLMAQRAEQDADANYRGHQSIADDDQVRHGRNHQPGE